MAKAIAYREHAAPASWHWTPPPFDLPAKDYGAALMANARKYMRHPEALTGRMRDGEIRPERAGRYNEDGYNLNLYCMRGGGWSGYHRCKVASWEGGKSWTLTGEHRGSAADALRFLNLPESDGRLLLLGAPAKPDKGVVKWRARWTISRGDLAGLTAVAGEGIDGRTVKKRLTVARDMAVQSGVTHRARVIEYQGIVDALPPLADLLAESERVRGMLERLTALADHGAICARTVEQVARLRQRAKANAALTAVQDGATALLDSLAPLHPGHLRIGVRATRADGTPRNRGGAFQSAHELGVGSVCPDYDGRSSCGAGLHYIPAVNMGGARDGAYCVQNAMTYSDKADVALWIVLADEAVQIDNQKAKARILTPIAYAGNVKGVGHANNKHHGRIMAALQAGESATWERERAEHAVVANRIEAERQERIAAKLTATLREWNAMGKAAKAA